jgi:hypothetical protein
VKHVFYYMTADPAVMAAYRADLLDIARIEATGEAFAKMFGGIPLFTAGYGSHFAGITFRKGTLPVNAKLWTKIDERQPCLPRSPERAGSDVQLRAAAEALYKRFWDNWPKEIAQERVSRLYTALGVTFEQLENELFVFDEYKGDGYFMSTLQFDLPHTEITTSDYLRIIETKRKSNG